jgi:NAD+ synthase
MPDNLKIITAQINPIVGNVEYNLDKIKEIYDKYADGVDLVVFPELAITGYPPEDLLLLDNFIDITLNAQKDITEFTKDRKAGILFGGISSEKDKLYNCAIFSAGGKLNKIIRKISLPNYGVFDEKRYFHPGESFSTIEVGGEKLLIILCEDLWSEDLIEKIENITFDNIISINASPFTADKLESRILRVANVAKKLKKNFLYLNLIGGQDSLVFDGYSFLTNARGEISQMLNGFSEDIKTVSFNGEKTKTSLPCKEERIYNACLIGIRDYFHKNNNQSALIGSSGGVDSALCATLCSDALGSDNTHLVKLPSKFTSDESFSDADKLIEKLGCKNILNIDIEPIYLQIINSLEPIFKNLENDLTEENIQSRIRGMLLMALSNKFGHLVLSTGNKSELAVGYATIYGDMCGAYAPIKDIYKSSVFAICKWRNDNIPDNSKSKINSPIHSNIIEKAPTAELRENQKDSDSLPEYDILDVILENLIEKKLPRKQIVKLGFEKEIVEHVSQLLSRSEYKRNQAAMGPKISELDFERDRRFPITNGYKF